MTAALATPTLLIIISAIIFLILERVRPGRELPNAPGWYGRALLVNAGQIAITFSTATVWTKLFGSASLFKLAALQLPLLEGFIGWFVGTFFFYWWHRIRHMNGWWQLFHQVHHSPARIEAITSFYKHPVEILVDFRACGRRDVPACSAARSKARCGSTSSQRPASSSIIRTSSRRPG